MPNAVSLVQGTALHAGHPFCRRRPRRLGISATYCSLQPSTAPHLRVTLPHKVAHGKLDPRRPSFPDQEEDTSGRLEKKNISDYLARLHAFWTARARPSGGGQGGTARAQGQSQLPHAGGVRSWGTKRSGVRGRNANQPSRHVAIMGAPRGRGRRGPPGGRARWAPTCHGVDRPSTWPPSMPDPTALLWNSRTCACRLACLVECWPTSCASFQASAESDDRQRSSR